jgi:dTDP-4-amino-4,6-dideoxygalactose transaminase
MKVPLCIPTITDEMKNAVLNVLDSHRYIKGPKISEFEDKFARYCGVKYGSAVSSGTSAIYLALRALDIGPKDEVIVPSFTFIASATPILFVGAKPVFVDVGHDYLMDMDDLKKKITKKTKAVVCVHLYGQMCDMDRLLELKEKYGFYLIEDACQAHGAEFKGKKSGSFGDIGCFSFFPSKNMTVCGDGGMTVTNDKELKNKIDMLRDHGRDYSTEEGKFKSTILGFNFRMSEISAAIGIEQLKHLDGWIKKRREIAKTYDNLITDKVVKPFENKNRKHVYHVYAIRSKKRDELRKFLSKNDIETGIHYPLAIHQQPIFSGRWNLPLTEKFCKEILSIPIFPSMKKEQIEFVAEKINEFFK